MVKNIVYDFQLRRQKFEQDNKKTIRTEKYKIKVEPKGLPDDYPKDGSVDDKVEYLKKRLPPRKGKKLVKVDGVWTTTDY